MERTFTGSSTLAHPSIWGPMMIPSTISTTTSGMGRRVNLRRRGTSRAIAAITATELKLDICVHRPMSVSREFGVLSNSFPVQPRRVDTTTPACSVRCTGHLSAIARRAARCPSSNGPVRATVPVDVLQLGCALVAGLAIIAVQARVDEIHGYVLEGPPFSLRVHADCHRGARTKAREQVLVRIGAGIRADW